ncbi:MAG TPA: thioredoxin domain-containing protein, partial [Tepidisphaeraceae bacterium]|nr:thioredoxin domain-containing protein [Tepidisphaeraceae bacterium]
MNRLSKQTSPYLLQHQHNPVDWYPWGPEAFSLARTENKPIFLSVGYSTCYWCHVMERQCFENPAIAKLMNDLFINIKVDREERPDVDQLYMTAVQVLTHHGGWPMSVFLTPDLRPFYAGTYFPPTDTQGRPGFPTVLKSLSDAFLNRKEDVESSANEILHILQQLAEPRSADHPITIDQKLIESLLARSISDYDPTNGGFGRSPKFPRQTLLELLLTYTSLHTKAHGPLSVGSSPRDLHPRITKMLTHTFTAMAAGGIRDHLGGGFHRYSTDAHWLVPHFEIMLYDNAMLSWCYTELYRQTNDEHYASIARGIFDFILREMTSPAGTFYTAFDAEVDSQEGLNYLWTKDEIEDLLGESDASLFNRIYGVDEGPNFSDPHHGTGQPGKNILFLPESLSAAANRLNLTESELESKLQPMRAKLLAARAQRKQPLLDTKILPSWNALMIRALAHGGSILSEPRYTTAATRAADVFLKANSFSFLDDYAFLTLAFTQLWQSTKDAKWRDHATQFQSLLTTHFADPLHGGFYFTPATADDLIVRQKTATDSPLPSGNAAAALAMLSLNNPTGVTRILQTFAAQLEQQAESMSALLQAALLHLTLAGPVTFHPSSTPTHPPTEIVQVTPEWTTPRHLSLHLTISPDYHINAHQTSPD